MKVIAGLGNPGKEYEGTRHNIGFEVLRELARGVGIGFEKKTEQQSLIGKGKIEGADVLLMLPQTFMNLSGETIKQWMGFYKVDPVDLLVVHDELDLPVGKVKLSFGVSSAGHNGAASIIEALGTKDFYRFRFGIGKPRSKAAGVDYVLAPFHREEKTAVQAQVTKAVQGIVVWVKLGFNQAQQFCAAENGDS